MIVACDYIEAGAPETDAKTVCRLEKVDVKDGLPSLQSVTDSDVPYLVFLYERLRGAPPDTPRKLSTNM